jgi:hypothetical protein
MESLLKLVYQQRFIGTTAADIEPLLMYYQQRFLVEQLLIMLFRQIKKSDAFFIFLSFLINRYCFKVNLFIRLDIFFPCSLINRLIKLIFL